MSQLKIPRSFVRITHALLLILAVWMTGAAEYRGNTEYRHRANRTGYDTILISAKNMRDSSLRPMPFLGEITIIKSHPKKDLFPQRRVFQELLVRQNKPFCVVAKSFILGKKNNSIRTARPLIRDFRESSNGNQPRNNRHQLNIKSRGLSYVLNKESHTELFSHFRLPILPPISSILSRLNPVIVITNPRSLLQTRSFPSSIESIPTRTPHIPVHTQRSSARVQRFSGQLVLFPSLANVKNSRNSEDYRRYCQNPVWLEDRRDHFDNPVWSEDYRRYRQNPVWPYTLIFIFGFTLQVLGAGLIFPRACRNPLVYWRALVLGFFFIAVSLIPIHTGQPIVERWLWEWKEERPSPGRIYFSPLSGQRILKKWFNTDI